MRVPVIVALAVWAAVEVSLVVRDLARGKGSTARDRGTRSLLVGGWLVAFLAAMWVAVAVGQGSGWRLGRWHLPAGLIVMWIGLAIRIWAVVVLGSAFRTTVEVDAGQRIVDSGPYRLVRHPSYTGILLIAVGFGLTLGNWLSAAILLVIPVAHPAQADRGRRGHADRGDRPALCHLHGAHQTPRARTLVTRPGTKRHESDELLVGVGPSAIGVVPAVEPVH